MIEISCIIPVILLAFVIGLEVGKYRGFFEAKGKYKNRERDS